MKRKIAVGILVAGLFALIASAAHSQGKTRVVEKTLFGGSDTDSTEQVSDWIYIEGANRIVIKTWSDHAGGALGADSTSSDSITTFSLFFTDSTTSTYSDFGTILGADTLEFDPAVAATDSTTLNIGAYPLPINKELRYAANGGGVVTVVYPLSPGLTTPDNSGHGVIPRRFMRVKATPLRRKTGGTSEESTGCCRVDGLEGFSMKAFIYYDNR